MVGGGGTLSVHIEHRGGLYHWWRIRNRGRLETVADEDNNYGVHLGNTTSTADEEEE